MRTLFFLAFIACMVVTTSCEKEVTIILTPEQRVELNEFLSHIDDMQNSENAQLSNILLEFYNSRNSRACDPSNFDFISENDLVDYSKSLGFQSHREMHDWFVDYGMLLRESISDPYALMDDMAPALRELFPILLEESGFGQYAESRSLENNECTLELFVEFSYYAVMKANTYGVRNSFGFREPGRAQLIGWGSSLHRTFILLSRTKDCT